MSNNNFEAFKIDGVDNVEFVRELPNDIELVYFTEEAFKESWPNPPYEKMSAFRNNLNDYIKNKNCFSVIDCVSNNYKVLSTVKEKYQEWLFKLADENVEKMPVKTKLEYLEVKSLVTSFALDITSLMLEMALGFGYGILSAKIHEVPEEIKSALSDKGIVH